MRCTGTKSSCPHGLRPPEQLQNTPQLIYMSLNENSVYCVMPRSSEPPDTCKWGGLKLRGILKFSPSAFVSTLTTSFVCGVAVVSSVVVMSSHLITNRMRFYFFRSKRFERVFCVSLPQLGEGCNAKKLWEDFRVRSLRISWAILVSQVILVSWAILDAFWVTSDWWQIKILVAFLIANY